MKFTHVGFSGACRTWVTARDSCHQGLCRTKPIHSKEGHGLFTSKLLTLKSVYTYRIIILNLGHHRGRWTSINRSWNQREWQDFSPWGTGEEIFNLEKQRCEWGFGTVCSYFKSCRVEGRLNHSAEIKAKISDGCETMDDLALYKGDWESH